MKKIVCACCEPRPDGRIIEGAQWILYDSVPVCESCRRAAIEWMLLMGFNFSHPFIREISEVESSLKFK